MSTTKNHCIDLPFSTDFAQEQAYKRLRAELGFTAPTARVIAVSSTRENEGKTTVALGLAQSLAQLGHRVLLLDADLRDSDLTGHIGLSDILSGTATLDACLLTTREEGLSVLPAGSPTVTPQELLSIRALSDLLDSCRAGFDYVIVDTPAAGCVQDAALVGIHCDGVVLVAANNAICYTDLRRTAGDLGRHGIAVLGLVRTNCKA